MTQWQTYQAVILPSMACYQPEVVDDKCVFASGVAAVYVRVHVLDIDYQLVCYSQQCIDVGCRYVERGLDCNQPQGTGSARIHPIRSV